MLVRGPPGYRPAVAAGRWPGAASAPGPPPAWAPVRAPRSSGPASPPPATPGSPAGPAPGSPPASSARTRRCFAVAWRAADSRARSSRPRTRRAAAWGRRNRGRTRKERMPDAGCRKSDGGCARSAFGFRTSPLGLLSKLELRTSHYRGRPPRPGAFAAEKRRDGPHRRGVPATLGGGGKTTGHPAKRKREASGQCSTLIQGERRCHRTTP
jgi:hypothetical protein